jgi:hypothetical protein
VETRREPARAVREPAPVARERSVPRPQRANEHVATRTATPAGWQSRAVRGQAQHAAWDGHRAQRWGSEHRTWRARGGYQGYRIPNDRYRAVFGPRHRFRVDRYPLVIVSGYPRFYYGGYWVTLIDPWPEYWAGNWYAQDDCYVTYVDDGYYLTNAQYPSVRIAVSFTLELLGAGRTDAPRDSVQLDGGRRARAPAAQGSSSSRHSKSRRPLACVCQRRSHGEAGVTMRFRARFSSC